jgi:hypothetical protein
MACGVERGRSERADFCRGLVVHGGTRRSERPDRAHVPEVEHAGLSKEACCVISSTCRGYCEVRRAAEGVGSTLSRNAEFYRMANPIALLRATQSPARRRRPGGAGNMTVACSRGTCIRAHYVLHVKLVGAITTYLYSSRRPHKLRL